MRLRSVLPLLLAGPRGHRVRERDDQHRRRRNPTQLVCAAGEKRVKVGTSGVAL